PSDLDAETLRLLQQRGVQPVNLKVRTVEGPGVQLGAANSGYATLSGIDRFSGHGHLGEPSIAKSDVDLMHEHRRALYATGADSAAATHAGRSIAGDFGG